MHLKRLELIGFKSFAQKTALDFPAGITAIVGPNGSGKSNVIDAVRWVLGEREAKNIRGVRAEDLIFAGTPQRPRMGMAQVTMFFDNRRRFFPVDYVEVSVKRQMARDGTSEYFLNDAPVRLKDIIEFFSKAHLGTKGLTIVNQGNSDIFVKASPRERRVMIEEVLGLRQYQLKKHEAELKLVGALANLEKVKALIEEIAPHLRLLRRQAAKYAKQAELDQELRGLEKEYFGGKLGLIAEERQSLAPEIHKIETKLKKGGQELGQLQDRLSEIDKSSPESGEDFEEFRKQRAELFGQKAVVQKELGRVEGQIELLISQPMWEIGADEAIQLLEEARDVIQKAIATENFLEAKSALQALSKKVESALSRRTSGRKPQVQELEKSKDQLLRGLGAAEEELAKLKLAEDKLAERFREFNAQFKKAFEEVEAKKDEVNNLENSKNKLFFEQERVNMRRQELENLAAQAGRKISDFEDALRHGSGQPPQINFAEVERRMFKLRAELAGIGELDPALIKEAQEIEARYNFLTEQSGDLKKATADLKGLIKELDDKIHGEFTRALQDIDRQFSEFFKVMFGGGRARLKLQKLEDEKEEFSDEEVRLKDGELAVGAMADQKHKEDHGGIEVEVSIPRKKISGLDMLSGGERALVSIAALFALIAVSPPPFLILDEIDAALDEHNTKRFAGLVEGFSKKTQFILVTHNRATMEVADILYGVTMGDDGTSRTLSLKLESGSPADLTSTPD